MLTQILSKIMESAYDWSQLYIAACSGTSAILRVDVVICPTHVLEQGNISVIQPRKDMFLNNKWWQGP